MKFPDFPVKAFLPQICEKVKIQDQLIVVAAPGAGKTTLLPPALLEVVSGKILLVEPRRIASRAAAARIAEIVGEKPGYHIGYAVRGENCQSPDTRLLVVTPGVLLALLHEDPSLEGIDCVIFDEFHERQMQVDLALTLTLASRQAFESKLKLVVMSATLDTNRLAPFLDAEVLSIPGKVFPVAVTHTAASGDVRDIPLECARAVLKIFPETSGDILVFLPGAGEITRTLEMLATPLQDQAEILPLHGTLDFAAQKRVFAPGKMRRVILATNLAESSITVPGIECVIDSGWEKHLRFDPGAGLSFLETQRISRHSAEQRAGRAGRLAPGKAIRLYSVNDELHFPGDTKPEILECDLAPLALEIAAWGARVDELLWLDAPDTANFAVATRLLQNLGALDEKERITPLGCAMAQTPVHPRLAAMILKAQKLRLGATACRIAALLEERDNACLFRTCDLRERVEMLQKTPKKLAQAQNLYEKLRQSCRISSDDFAPESCGELVAFAFPEWVARRRAPQSAEYILAESGGARLFDPGDAVSSEFLAIARLDAHSAGKSVIRLAAPISRESVEKLFADRIATHHLVELSPDCRATGFAVTKLGSIVLNKKPESAAPYALTSAILAEAIRRGIALPPADDKKATQLLERVRFAHTRESDAYPDWGENIWQKILQQEETAMLLGKVRDLAELAKQPWFNVMRQMLGETTFQQLERAYPAEFRTAAGATHPIDYTHETPQCSVKIQELYGQDVHPTVGKMKLPLRLELLSPAGRPVQITCDLPGFWRGSWEAVRREMKSRYPKHLWAEDPLAEKATFRTVKPKKA